MRKSANLAEGTIFFFSLRPFNRTLGKHQTHQFVLKDVIKETVFMLIYQHYLTVSVV